MITFRLFHSADPFREIESRAFAESELLVGRDKAAQWRIEDASCEISRRHCLFEQKGGRITVQDLSANGVFLGPEKRRAPKSADVTLNVGDAVHLGQFTIIVDVAEVERANDAGEAPAPALAGAPFHAPLLAELPLDASAFTVRTQWSAGHAAAAAACRGDAPATLLEAFCEGAQLDPSFLAGEDPAEVMRRAGAMYQLVVLGLGDLMNERTALKSDYRMNSTTVAAVDNNPLKWAPTQRVAIDLLRTRVDGFLSGPAAFKASFEDLRKHLLCVMAGSRAAVAAAIDELSPAKVEADAKGQPFLFAGTLWGQFKRRHADLREDARTNPDSTVNRAFKAGYEQHLRHLDDMGTVS